MANLFFLMGTTLADLYFYSFLRHQPVTGADNRLFPGILNVNGWSFTLSNKDSTDAHDKSAVPERPRLEAADVQQARNASGQIVTVAEGHRTNASDGSLRDRAKPIAEQDNSIQIMGMAGVVASRTNKLSEKDLAEKRDPVTKSITVRELLAKPEKQAQELVEEFGRVTNMPAGPTRDADLFKVQQLADKTYNRGQFAETAKESDVSNSNVQATDRDKITAKPFEATSHLIKSGLDYNENKIPISQKFADFAKSAQARLLDPAGRKAYFQGIIDETLGVGEGLNIAKQEVKESAKQAATKAWTALANGSVANFMATPNAINAPLFKTIGSCLDIMSRDPNAVNNVLTVMGRELQNSSDKYGKMSPHDRGVQDGKAMFFFINPEGSTEAADVAIKAADKVATHVDKKVFDGITIAMRSADKLAQTAPELAAQSREMVREYMQQLKLSPQELQYAGVPSRYVEELNPASDNILMMEGKPNDFVKNLDGLDKVDELRLQHNVDHGRNIGYATVEVDGEASELVGVSGRKSPGGTVPLPKNPRFDPVPQGCDPADSHSELKILEHVAEKANESSLGVVNLYSERVPCPSCTSIIKQFREAFTGIVVNVEYGRNRW